jgi:tRNA (adenine57-N1/adenine58-N1)-methyltransferase
MKNRFILIDCEGRGRIYFENISLDNEFISTHKGNISVKEINNAKWGSVIHTHKGHAYRIVEVDINDYIMFGLKRETQIIYPKDSGFITINLGIKTGDKVFECGCGSGALTLVLANIVAPNGKIVCYERRERFINLAVKNLQFNNLIDYVEIKQRDLETEEIEDENYDAAFIDTKEPWQIIEKVTNALKPGKKLGILVPTFNQIVEVLKELRKVKHFDVSVKEILIREFKTIPDRLRPEDRMVAHTGFLIFSRKGV